jgi:hypothetical protein
MSSNLYIKRHEANIMHKLTGRRYHVVKLYGKLIVTDRLGIKRLKQKKILKKSFDYIKLTEISLYDTKQQKNVPLSK